MDEKSLLGVVLELLRTNGATGDVYFEHLRSLSVRVREGAVDQISRSEVRGLAVRALVDQRLGFVHTSNLDPDVLRLAVAQACELARFASPREELSPAQPAGPGLAFRRLFSHCCNCIFGEGELHMLKVEELLILTQ